MPKDKDYYKTLGVEKDAAKADIKKAYKKLAKKHHPDLNPDDAEASEKFKEINEAAAILGDEEKRRQYDQFGTTAEGFRGFGGAQGFDFSDFMQDIGGFGFDFDSIFDRFFGGGGGGSRRRRAGPRRGSDLETNVEITLEEALDLLVTKGNLNLSFNRSRLPLGQMVSLQAINNTTALDALLSILEQTATELVITTNGQLVVIPSKADGQRP